MESKSPWNIYGEAKVQELENELCCLRTAVEDTLSAANRIEKLLEQIKLFCGGDDGR